MKKWWIVPVSVAFLVMYASFCSSAALDKGFLNYTWGSDISRYDNLKKLYSKGDVSYYANPDVEYTIDDILIKNVIFGFYQDQFFAVYLRIDSFEIYDTLTLYMKSKYGIPSYKATEKDQMTLKWKHEDVIIKQKINKTNEKMKLAFYYAPLSKKLNSLELGEEIEQGAIHFVPIDKRKKPERFRLLEF